MNFSIHPCGQHDPLISSSLTWSSF